MNIDNNKVNAATQAKKRWNAEHYKVVKTYVNPETASAFKAACEESGTSMASALTQFVSEYIDTEKKRKVKPAPDYSTRGKRRTAVKYFAQQMELILASEELCRDNTPENLQGSLVYEKADEYAAQLEEAVEMLGSI